MVDSTKQKKFKQLFYDIVGKEAELFMSKMYNGGYKGKLIAYWDEINQDFVFTGGYVVSGECVLDYNHIFITSKDQEGSYTLSIPFPDSEFSCPTHFFARYDRKDHPVYRFDGDEMLEQEEFKKYVIQFLADVCPERIYEMEEILS